MLDYYIMFKSERCSSPIIDFDYDSSSRTVGYGLNKIGMVSENKMMYFCEIDFNHLNLETTIKTIKIDELQTRMWYLKSAGMWMTVGSEFTMRVWKVVEEDVEEILVSPMIGHSDVITDVQFVSRINCLISSSLDGTLKIWNGSFRLKFTECIKKTNISNTARLAISLKKEKDVDGIRGKKYLIIRFHSNKQLG